MAIITRTPAEILRHLRKTDSPTILVEGVEDTMACRWLLEHFHESNAQVDIGGKNIISCTGKDNLMKVVKKVVEEPHLYPFARLFVRDKDMFVFFEHLKPKYSLLCYTYGYSIENDLLIDAESDFENLLLLCLTRQTVKEQLLGEYLLWYAFRVNDLLSKVATLDDETEQRKIIEQGLDNLGINLQDSRQFFFFFLQFTPDFLKQERFIPPPKDLLINLQNNHLQLLRGHNLIDICHFRIAEARKRGEMKWQKSHVEIKLHLLTHAIRKKGHIQSLQNKMINALSSSPPPPTSH